ncbi:putative RNA-directed DNA polymerase from transposon BS [Takifugu flavidus]|uniref:Putative RNA-directed DNA polymerase from transposon BS n=1 Tax=Takifugu flavidus TaxID=433684 RepID=A0A5C6NFK6_9TELE|nr:putative RNA-directed DNA polymerase from transposon BS [Takifugu flavidus]
MRGRAVIKSRTARRQQTSGVSLPSPSVDAVLLRAAVSGAAVWLWQLRALCLLPPAASGSGCWDASTASERPGWILTTVTPTPDTEWAGPVTPALRHSSRPQFVRVKGSQSDRLLCSTGVPQGTVLAPFLFTLYTADFSYSTSSCHLQKFSDDSAAVGLITDGDDTGYRELIQGFVDWSLRNNLQINAGKTKELVVDFRRRNNPPPAPVNILGTDVDVVESYKYLGVHLNNNLDWTHNTDALVKKGNSRLFLLRRLRSFGVQGPLLRTFYDSVVGSAIFYGIVCWSSSITDRDRKRMDRLVRRASSVLGCPLDSVEVVGNGRMMAKLSSMLNNTYPPPYRTPWQHWAAPSVSGCSTLAV